MPGFFEETKLNIPAGKLKHMKALSNDAGVIAAAAWTSAAASRKRSPQPRESIKKRSLNR